MARTGAELTALQLVPSAISICKRQPRVLLSLGFGSALMTWTANIPLRALDSAAVGALLWLALIFFAFVVGVLVQGAIVHAVSQDASGQEPGIATAVQASLARLGDLLSAGLRAFLIPTGFAITIVGLPWAVQRAVRWYFVVQTIMLDGQDRHSALEFSSGLVTALGWRRIARRILAVAAITGIPTLLMLIAITTVARDFATASVLQIGVTGLTTPVYAAAITTMYLDLRPRVEHAPPGP